MGATLTKSRDGSRCLLALKYRTKGWSWAKVAQALGVNGPSTACAMAYRGRIITLREQGKVMGQLAAEYPDREVHRPRCACGLIRPCYSCHRTIYQVAAERLGTSSGDFDP